MWFKLMGDERLGRCATDGCGGQPTERLEAGAIGSNYCSGCRSKIEAAEWLDLETAPRDGSKFLADTCDFEHGKAFNRRVQEARWSGKTPDDRIGHFASDNGQMVTRWMPLPAAHEKHQ